MSFEKNEEAYNYTPPRFQLLLFTLSVAFYSLFKVMNDPTGFPNIPEELVMLLGGSIIFYLGSRPYQKAPIDLWNLSDMKWKARQGKPSLIC